MSDSIKSVLELNITLEKLIKSQAPFIFQIEVQGNKE
jgi:hypothetical protein